MPGCGTRGLDAPGTDADERVGFGKAATDVVRDEYPRPAGSAPDDRIEQRDRTGIDGRPRLVEQEQRRVVQDRTCRRDALAHAARELLDPVVGAAGQSDGPEHLIDPLLIDAVQARRELKVLTRAQRAVERRLVT